MSNQLSVYMSVWQVCLSLSPISLFFSLSLVCVLFSFFFNFCWIPRCIHRFNLICFFLIYQARSTFFKVTKERADLSEILTIERKNIYSIGGWVESTIPETFYFFHLEREWTGSARLANGESIRSERWRTLNGIWWALMNDGRTQSAKASERRTMNARSTICERRMTD